MRPQVEAGHYLQSEYLGADRFASYACQVSSIISLRPRTVLEIGCGNGIVSFLLSRAGVGVTRLDVDRSLRPDLVGSVTGIPLDDGSFDCVACFQVLEHLPFDQFGKAVAEISRVTRAHAVISLPDTQRYVKCELHLPKLGTRRLLVNLPHLLPRAHRFDSQHHWEIGKRGYPLRRVVGAIQDAGFRVLNTFRAFAIPYHRFFVLQKPQESP